MAAKWGAVASIALLGIVIAAVFLNTDISEGLEHARNLSALILFVIGTALLLNVLAAALRLKVIAVDTGNPISFSHAMSAVSVSSLAGAVFFQIFGQIAARGVIMGRAGITFATVIAVTGYERAVAAIVSALLALAGAYFIFGHVILDKASGGGEFIKIACGLLAATTAGALLGYGRAAAVAIAPMLTRHFAIKLLRIIALSILVQLPMMAAYTVTTHALAPNISSMQITAASAIIMFVASVPISFAGFGVRELSAVLALKTIGVGASEALLAALVVGIGSVLVMAITSIISTQLFVSDRKQPHRDAMSSFDYHYAVA